MNIKLEFFSFFYKQNSTSNTILQMKQIFFLLFIMQSAYSQNFVPKILTIVLSTDNTSKKVISIPWNERFSNDSLLVEMKWDETENRYKLRLRAFVPLVLESVVLQANYKAASPESRYFCNGFQSWTTSREYAYNERIPRLHPLLNAYSKNAGDYYLYKHPRKNGNLHAWTWTYWRNADRFHVLASLSENNGFTSFRFDTKEEQIFIEKDCQGYVLAADKDIELFDFLYKEANGYIDYSDFMAEYARNWREKLESPRPAIAAPAMGWTSWYYYYANIDEKLLEENLNTFADKRLPIDIFQIDDGYQKAVGDWLQCNKKFPNGMKPLADKIHAKGYKAGIWLAPFVASKRSDIFKAHPDWFVKKPNGKPLMVAKNVIWKGPYYALDIYKPEARAYIQRVLKTILYEWNYDLIKVDFLFAACLQARPDRTRGQIMYDAMQLLQEAAGKDKQILGCGVPLASAFGQVDYCRIGNDAHTGWELKPLKRLHAHERPSTWSTLTNSIHRYVLSGKFFQNDPDVFILRNKKTKLNETQKNTMFLVNQLFGEVLFISDDLREYDEKQLATYSSGFPLRQKSNLDILYYSENVYRVRFFIGIREYVAYINLDKAAVTVPCLLEHKEYYDAIDNQILKLEKQKGISLAAYESKCFYVLNSDSVELLGGVGHVFSGADIDFIEWIDENTLNIGRHPKARSKKPVYLRVNDVKIETMKINGASYKVEKIGTFRGVLIKF